MNVAVIGAGPSGLVAIKELVEEGHTVRCYEQNDDIGGNFHPRHGLGSRGLRLTVSQHFMVFSSLAASGGPREFWTGSEYLSYLRGFELRFGLREYIQFNTGVRRIGTNPDGQFEVEYERDGITGRAAFDAVAICVGAFRKGAPRSPELKGSFSGKVTHSADYNGPEPFIGKRVLCVGFGETAADVLTQIAPATRSCAVSFRHYPSLVARWIPGARNMEYTTDAFTCRALHYLPRSWYNSLLVARARRYLRRNPEEQRPSHRLVAEWRVAGQTPAHRSFQKNDEFTPFVQAGQIKVIPSGVVGADGKLVRFQDGTTFEADVVVHCTGYDESTPPPLVQGLTVDDIRDLYAHMFHPDVGARLAFVGWARPAQGGLPACAEMQSRLFARVLSAKRRLPGDGPLREAIRADREREDRMYFAQTHIRTLCLYTDYMNRLADLIGCRPRLWRYVGRPALLLRLLFGSNVAACYRLEGPHADPEVARAAIMRLSVAYSWPRMVELAVLNLAAAGMRVLRRAMPLTRQPDAQSFAPPRWLKVVGRRSDHGW